MGFYRGYIVTKDKTSKEKYKERDNLKTLDEVQNQYEFAGVLAEDAVLIDVDDEPQSELLLQMVKDLELKCQVLKSNRGMHFLFKNTDTIEKSFTKQSICVGLVNIDCKCGKSACYEVLRKDGIDREVLYDTGEYQDVPKWLKPVRSSSDFLHMTEGSRNDSLFRYILTLTNAGLSKDETRETIQLLNRYVLPESLDDSELDVILRDDAFKVNNDSINGIGSALISEFNLITMHQTSYQYKNGYYQPVAKEMLGKWIRLNYPTITERKKNEILSYTKDISYTESVNEERKLINVKNGLLQIDGNSVELLPHTPEIISFHQFNANYDSESTSELLNTTLEQFFDGDKDLILLFGEIAGYLLMNHCDYQKCFCFVGKPSSGKSIILNMLRFFCGTGGTSSLSLNDLNHNFRVSDLVGKIANINADLDKLKINSTGNFKNLVSGDPITVEKKFSDPVSFRNTAKLIFASNTLPNMSADIEGIHRRMIILPCNHVFSVTDSQYDPKISEKLCSPETMSALLNMGIDGYIRLINNGKFTEPNAIQKTATEFKQENNSVLMWLNECDITDHDLLSEPVKHNYTQYREFCYLSGIDSKAMKDFSRSISQEYGYETKTKRINGERFQMFIENNP